MKRYSEAAGTEGSVIEATDGEYVLYEDHIEAMKRIAGAPVAEGLTDEQIEAIHDEIFGNAGFLPSQYRMFAHAILAKAAPSASAQQAEPVEIDWQHLYNEMAKKYASACNEIARLDVLDSEYRSKDGSISATDAVGGVIDLFPGADRQALNALADLLCRPVATPAPSASRAAYDCCANCMRPSAEHHGDSCPPPYTTVWHAWDYDFPPDMTATPSA